MGIKLIHSILTLTAVLSGCAGLAAQESDSANLVQGEQVYQQWCAACHAAGPKHPGTQALDALYQGARPGVLIERTDLTPVFVATFVRKGVSVMAPFRKTEISDDELKDLAEYISTAGLK